MSGIFWNCRQGYVDGEAFPPFLIFQIEKMNLNHSTTELNSALETVNSKGSNVLYVLYKNCIFFEILHPASLFSTFK